MQPITESDLKRDAILSAKGMTFTIHNVKGAWVYYHKRKGKESGLYRMPILSFVKEWNKQAEGE
jgi:hypothetical protein